MAVKGVLHNYASGLVAFEHENDDCKNILLFIGGLGDNLGSVPYVKGLAQDVRQRCSPGTWGVAELQLRSSGNGFGLSSLEKDMKDIEMAVKYFRHLGKKSVALIGHSTGSQDCMYYALNSKIPVDKIMLQAGISDREGVTLDNGVEKVDQLVSEAREYIKQGKSFDILPKSFRLPGFGSPITAYRFVSLFGERGDDDFFSSYLTDEEFGQTFGKLTTPVLILLSGSDQFVPAHVDKDNLVARWKAATPAEYWCEGSGIVPGASHDLDPNDTPAEARRILSERVVDSLST